MTLSFRADHGASIFPVTLFPWPIILLLLGVLLPSSGLAHDPGMSGLDLDAGAAGRLQVTFRLSATEAEAMFDGNDGRDWFSNALGISIDGAGLRPSDTSQFQDPDGDLEGLLSPNSLVGSGRGRTHPLTSA